MNILCEISFPWVKMRLRLNCFWCVYVVRHWLRCVFENFQFHFFSYTLRRMCKSSEFLIKITTLCSFPKEIFFLIMVQEMPNKVLLCGVVREWWILYVILSFWVRHNFTCCHGLIMILSIFFLNIYNFSKVKPNDVNEGKFSREAITQDNNWKKEAYWYIFKNRNNCASLPNSYKNYLKRKNFFIQSRAHSSLMSSKKRSLFQKEDELSNISLDPH